VLVWVKPPSLRISIVPPYGRFLDLDLFFVLDKFSGFLFKSVVNLPWRVNFVLYGSIETPSMVMYVGTQW